MITCSVLGGHGRLGNQLWQVASTIGIAESRGEPVSFPRWDYAPYFSIPEEYFSGASGTEATDLVPHLPPVARTYLQDYNLFKDSALLVRTLLKPSPEARERIDEFEEFYRLRKPTLSVHVRRGDNVPGADAGVVDKHLYHPMPTIDYYRRAIEMYDGQYQSIAVFSDDPTWCLENIAADYYHFGRPRAKEHLPQYKSEPFSDWIDLLLMTQCKHHVIANSTYGWWGAFLAEDDSPIVPKPWFGPRIDSDENLMFPPGWRRLERESEC